VVMVRRSTLYLIKIIVHIQLKLSHDRPQHILHNRIGRYFSNGHYKNKKILKRTTRCTIYTVKYILRNNRDLSRVFPYVLLKAWRGAGDLLDGQRITSCPNRNGRVFLSFTEERRWTFATPENYPTVHKTLLYF